MPSGKGRKRQRRLVFVEADFDGGAQLEVQDSESADVWYAATLYTHLEDSTCVLWYSGEDTYEGLGSNFRWDQSSLALRNGNGEIINTRWNHEQQPDQGRGTVTGTYTGTDADAATATVTGTVTAAQSNTHAPDTAGGRLPGVSAAMPVAMPTVPPAVRKVASTSSVVSEKTPVPSLTAHTPIAENNKQSRRTGMAFASGWTPGRPGTNPVPDLKGAHAPVSDVARFSTAAADVSHTLANTRVACTPRTPRKSTNATLMVACTPTPERRALGHTARPPNPSHAWRRGFPHAFDRLPVATQLLALGVPEAAGTCGHCRKKVARTPQQRQRAAVWCTHCVLIRYCDGDCRRAHWISREGAHNTNCPKIQAVASAHHVGHDSAALAAVEAETEAWDAAPFPEFTWERSCACNAAPLCMPLKYLTDAAPGILEPSISTV